MQSVKRKKPDKKPPILTKNLLSLLSNAAAVAGYQESRSFSFVTKKRNKNNRIATAFMI